VQLSERYAQARQQALWAASKLVARYRKVGHVSDLPAAAYHLDKALGELHGAMGLMRPLAEEWDAALRNGGSVVRDANEAGAALSHERSLLGRCAGLRTVFYTFGEAPSIAK
jgi:hypothetical protein